MARAVKRPPRTKPARRPSPAAVKSFSASQEPDEFGDTSGAHPAAPPAAGRPAPRKPLTELSWADFDRLVQKLATAARARFKPTAVVGLVHGGVFVGGAIASALKVDFFPVRVAQRSRDHQEGADELYGLPAVLQGRRVLVVDDIAASGDSLEFAVRLARDRGVKHLATAALVARPGRYRPDFAALQSDELFVFPWDYASLTADARFDPEVTQVVAAARPAPRPRRPR